MSLCLKYFIINAFEVYRGIAIFLSHVNSFLASIWSFFASFLLDLLALQIQQPTSPGMLCHFAPLKNWSLAPLSANSAGLGDTLVYSVPRRLWSMASSGTCGTSFSIECGSLNRSTSMIICDAGHDMRELPLRAICRMFSPMSNGVCFPLSNLLSWSLRFRLSGICLCARCKESEEA